MSATEPPAANRVPFLDVRSAYLEISDELDAAYREVMESGWFIMGPQLEAFEREFADYCDAAYAIGVGTGLDALELVLRAWGVGPGDEVIVPAHTFVATWLAVSETGATPVAVDVDPATFNITAGLAENAITERTRVIIPVHLYGQAAAMTSITELAARHDLLVLEDSAQAHGATWASKTAGSMGDASAFSFYPAKNLGAFGDGGAITTNDADLAARLRRLRNYGSSKKYHHEEVGVNSRLDELQAALLRVRLRHLDAWNQRRRVVASMYTEGLAGVGHVRTPHVPQDAEPVWHLYAIVSEQRDALASHLDHLGVDSAVHYPIPPHRQPAYADAFLEQQFPVADRIAEQQLSLPIGPHLAHEDAERVIAAVASFVT